MELNLEVGVVGGEEEEEEEKVGKERERTPTEIKKRHSLFSAGLKKRKEEKNKKRE